MFPIHYHFDLASIYGIIMKMISEKRYAMPEIISLDAIYSFKLMPLNPRTIENSVNIKRIKAISPIKR